MAGINPPATVKPEINHSGIASTKACNAGREIAANNPMIKPVTKKLRNVEFAKKLNLVNLSSLISFCAFFVVPAKAVYKAVVTSWNKTANGNDNANAASGVTP